MGKINSILELQSWGFNTPNLLLTIPIRVTGTRNRNALIKGWSDQRARCESRGIKRVSIRTEKEGHSLCPHHPNVPLKDVSKILSHCLLGGYSTYIFEGIDPADCKLKGNIVYRDKLLHVEWIRGAGTVRDLEHKVPSHTAFNPYSDTILLHEEDNWLPIAQKYLDQSELIGRILEWSIYPYPVGHLQQPEIYWEHRPWS